MPILSKATQEQLPDGVTSYEGDSHFLRESGMQDFSETDTKDEEIFIEYVQNKKDLWFDTNCPTD